MSIQYGLIKRTGVLASDKLNAQAIKRDLITTNTLAHEIQQRCTATSADVLVVLEALSDLLGSYLLNGSHVKLDGIGTFSISMDGEVRMDKTGRPILMDARVRRVRFKAARKLMGRMEEATFTRQGAAVKVSASGVTEQDVRQAVETLCADNGIFTIRQLAEATNLTEATARRRLQPILDEGTIEKLGSRPKTIYRKAK